MRKSKKARSGTRRVYDRTSPNFRVLEVGWDGESLLVDPLEELISGQVESSIAKWTASPEGLRRLRALGMEVGARCKGLGGAGRAGHGEVGRPSGLVLEAGDDLGEALGDYEATDSQLLGIHKDLGGLPLDVGVRLLLTGGERRYCELLADSPLLTSVGLVLAPARFRAIHGGSKRASLPLGVDWRHGSYRDALKGGTTTLILSVGGRFSSWRRERRQRLIFNLTRCVARGLELIVHVPNGVRGLTLTGGAGPDFEERLPERQGRLLFFGFQDGAVPLEPYLELSIGRILSKSDSRYRMKLLHLSRGLMDRGVLSEDLVLPILVAAPSPPGKLQELTHHLASVAGRLLADKIQDFWAGEYHPEPVDLVTIPKRDGRKREIWVYGLEDRLLLGALGLLLQERTEGVLTPAAVGGVPGRSYPDTVQRVQRALGAGMVHGAAIDIADCFPSLPHEHVNKTLSRHLSPRLASAFGGVLAGLGTKGIRQGCPLSPRLANLALHDLIDEHVDGAFYLRFIDDILVLTRDQSASKVIDDVESRLEEAGMGLARSKEIAVHGGTTSYLGLEISADRVTLSEDRRQEIRKTRTYVDDPNWANRVWEFYKEILSEDAMLELREDLSMGEGDLPLEAVAMDEEGAFPLPEPVGHPPATKTSLQLLPYREPHPKDPRPKQGGNRAHDAHSRLPGPGFDRWPPGQPAPITLLPELDVACPLRVGGTIAVVTGAPLDLGPLVIPLLAKSLVHFGDLRQAPGCRLGRVAYLGVCLPLECMIDDKGQLDTFSFLSPAGTLRDVLFDGSGAIEGTPIVYVPKKGIDLLAVADAVSWQLLADVYVVSGGERPQPQSQLRSLCADIERGLFDVVYLDLYPIRGVFEADFEEELAGRGYRMKDRPLGLDGGELVPFLEVVRAADRCAARHGYRPTVLYEGRLDEEHPGRVPGGAEFNACIDQVLELRHRPLDPPNGFHMARGASRRAPARVGGCVGVRAFSDGVQEAEATASYLEGASEASLSRSGLELGEYDSTARLFQLACRSGVMRDQAIVVPFGERRELFSRPAVGAAVRDYFRPGSFSWAMDEGEGFWSAKLGFLPVPAPRLSPGLVTFRNPGGGPEDPVHGKAREVEEVEALGDRLGLTPTPGSGSGALKGDLYDDWILAEYKGFSGGVFDLRTDDVLKLEERAAEQSLKPVFIVGAWDAGEVGFLLPGRVAVVGSQPVVASVRLRADALKGRSFSIKGSRFPCWTLVPESAYLAFRESSAMEIDGVSSG